MNQNFQSIVEPIIPCKVCGEKSTLIGVVDFNKHCPLAGQKPMPICGIPIYYRQCQNCEFVFTEQFDNWGNSDFLDHIYNSEYGEIDPEYKDIRPQRQADGIYKDFELYRTEISFLDFGGGEGKLANLLEEKGFKKAISYDPFTPGSDVLPTEKFNLITALEVMEHVPDPKSTVESIANSLVDNGLIIFSTLILPTDFREQGVNWWYIAPRNGHISFYSRRTLSLLWKKFGFNVYSLGEGLHFVCREIPDFARHLFN